MASGKSTLAGKIASDRNLILLSEDVFLANLYPGEIASVADYVRFSDRLKVSLQAHIIELLSRGVSVVLDFPANTAGQRQWLHSLIDGSDASHELHFLVCSDDECKNRLGKRALEQPERSATDTPEMFDAMTKYFEPPDQANERFNVVRHEIGLTNSYSWR